MEFVYLGYEERSYTNKEGADVLGYNVYYAGSSDSVVGFKPVLKFNNERKSLGHVFFSKANFDKLGFVNLPPLSKVFISFNQYGSIESIRLAK